MTDHLTRRQLLERAAIGGAAKPIASCQKKM